MFQEIRDNFNLVEHPNILAFQKWVETEKAGFLIRQYFVNNLYDRIRHAISVIIMTTPARAPFSP